MLVFASYIEPKEIQINDITRNNIGETVAVTGVIESIKESSSGSSCFLELNDGTGKINLIIFESTLVELKDAGNLREVVVIELGTNGPFDEETGQAMIDAIGKERRIYWINIYASNRDYEKDVNDVIKALADKNENVNVIDWNAEVTKNPDYVHDGFYLTDEGLDAMTKLINTTAR